MGSFVTRVTVCMGRCVLAFCYSVAEMFDVIRACQVWTYSFLCFKQVYVKL